jgi:hypothetical protein
MSERVKLWVPARLCKGFAGEAAVPVRQMPRLGRIPRFVEARTDGSSSETATISGFVLGLPVGVFAG